MILKKHRNTLLTIIPESGLDPALFAAGDGTIDNKECFIIRLRNSPIRFAVRPWDDHFDHFEYFCSRFLSGFPLGDSTFTAQIEYLHNGFNEWLNDAVKPYLDEASTPDLWQLMEDTRSRTIRDIEAPDYSESFSEDEKTGIRLSINEFRLLIVNTFHPHKEELDAINNRLKYLSDAMDKHNKFDWKGIAISTVITIAVTLALDPEQFNQLVELFKKVFSTIIYLLP